MGNRYGDGVWRAEENDILKSIWQRDESISESNRMPGRTLAAMRMQARRLGLARRAPGNKPNLRRAITAFLAGARPMSSRELAMHFSKTQQSVDSVLRALREAKEIRIAGHVRAGDRVIRLWGIGGAPDEPRPDSRRSKTTVARNRTVKVREGKVISSSPAVRAIQVSRDPFIAAFFGAAHAAR